MAYDVDHEVAAFTGEPPARVLVIAGLVLSVLLPPVGLILTLIARHKQRQLGYSPDMVSTLALGLSFVFLVLGIILAVALTAGLMAANNWVPTIGGS